MDKSTRVGTFVTHGDSRCYTIEALCADVNSRTGLLWTLAISCSSRGRTWIHTGRKSSSMGGGRPTGRTEGSAFCSTCGGAGRGQLTFSVAFTKLPPRRTLLPSVLIPSVPPRCTQAYPRSARRSHNLQVHILSRSC